MMRAPMTLEKARAMAQSVIHARKKFGSQLHFPQPTYEILEALAVLEANGNWDAPTKDELTKANRQLAAANARAEKCAKKQEQA